MAKQKKNNPEEKNRPGLQKSPSPDPAGNDPVPSGKVKGPMGVGDPGHASVVKQPGVKRRKKRITTPPLPGSVQSTVKNLPLPKIGLPEKGTEDKETTPGDSSSGLKEQKIPNKPKGRTRPHRQEHPAGEKETPIPKKMSRHLEDPEIRAEEKMKLSNTSPVEELKRALVTLGKEVREQFPEEKEIRGEIDALARDMIPDPDRLRNMVHAFSTKARMAPEKIKGLLERILNDPQVVPLDPGKPGKKKRPEFRKKKVRTTIPDSSPSLFSDFDVHLFREGKHYHLYRKFGAHPMEHKGLKGTYFAMWAPNAEQVTVIGDFNDWNRTTHIMLPRWDHSGIWELFVPEAKKGELYKYVISGTNGQVSEKGDPFAFSWEIPPNTASLIWDLEFSWQDKSWMAGRKKKEMLSQPLSVYEVHLGSWKRVPEDNFRSLSYQEMARELPAYVREMGFTHVEFMPVMEHPFFGSWGYQITGYFAPSSRYGTPQDFMYLIDCLHREGIGVILDWVPSHFPSDPHGLHCFDGTYLFEHADPQKGFHPDWQSYIFNYGRNEVRAFLISNALFWLELYHADGLRVDAVASMLYLDYSRKDGEWEPNEYGGKENLEAIDFLKTFNEIVYREFPDVTTIAEESTAWPMVSKPTYIGGLGFGLKWMMGWMHDTLEYFSKDPVHRKHHQNTITFSAHYAFTENFMLPLSHDEVVYGKGSLFEKMPGDSWNKMANLRSLYAYMFAHPGAKMLFMGAEFGQQEEWNHDESLRWHLLESDSHRQLQYTIQTLNRVYRKEPALYEKQFSQEGFEWVDTHDEGNSIISFLRKGHARRDDLMIVCNFTPVPRDQYRVGIHRNCRWKEIFNSDLRSFGGSDTRNSGILEAESIPAHQRDFSLRLTLPPLGVIYLKEAEN